MKVVVEVALTPAQIAEIFCDLNDEDQAQFFIECTRIAQGWPRPQLMQWDTVGGHLRTCPCSTEEARDMVDAIAKAART